MYTRTAASPGGMARPQKPLCDIRCNAKAMLAERGSAPGGTIGVSTIIDKANEPVKGDLSKGRQVRLRELCHRGRLFESTLLQQQAVSNSKEQFANSPDLKRELINAIMGALDAHTTMSTQALNSTDVQNGIADVLLNHAGLYEGLRAVRHDVPSL